MHNAISELTSWLSIISDPIHATRMIIVNKLSFYHARSSCLSVYVYVCCRLIVFLIISIKFVTGTDRTQFDYMTYVIEMNIF